MSSPAAAISAAAFGPAAAASFDQPPVSRMLTKVSWACGEFSATSRNSASSWVQATVIGASPASAPLKRAGAGERLLEAVEVEAAKLVRLRHLGRAATADRFRIERHGLLAAANQEARRRRAHFEIPWTRCIKRAVALSRSSAVTARADICKIQRPLAPPPCAG